ncbi:hypothetical protein ATO13_23176 [Stappia sp. 22II-S9-Z10]|nr:hypothetical protein ATO13_23176 [Stappia sp. 22II-S9-Z10]
MRMVDWPVGLAPRRITPPLGPNVYRSGVNETTGGGQQTFAGVGGRLRWGADFPPMTGRLAREAEGAITDAGNGANVIRMPWIYRDRRSPTEAGATPVEWGGGVAWDGGVLWGPKYPTVTPKVFHPVGASVVQLTNQEWGHHLGRGEWIGFEGVFAAHRIMRVLAEGVYHVWPPMRAPIAASENKCTLNPVVACTVATDSVKLIEDLDRVTLSVDFVEFLHSKLEIYVS